MVGLDVLDVVYKLAFVITAMYGVIFGLRQYAQASAQREVEHRWTQAQTAKTLIYEMYYDEMVYNAAKMLTWRSGQMFEISPGKREMIEPQKAIEALATRHGTLTCEEICFVQDCFEALLWHITYIEHFIQVNLIRFSDVEFPLGWAVKKLGSKEIQPLIRAYSDRQNFGFTERFCSRFDASIWPRRGKETV